MTRRSELGCSAAPRGGPQKRKCAAPPLTSLRSSEYTVAQSCAATHVDACATIGITRTSPGDACTVLAPDVRIVCSHQLAFLQLYEFHIL